MNQERLETEFIAPLTTKIVKHFARVDNENIIEEYIKFFNCSLFGHFIYTGTKGNVERGRMFFHSTAPEWWFVNTVRRTYNFADPKMNNRFTHKNELKILKECHVAPRSKHDIAHLIIGETSSQVETDWVDALGMARSSKTVSIKDLSDTHLYDYCIKQVKDMKSIAKNLESRRERRARSIDEIFSLG